MKYTLRLETGGKEVWNQWTGDVREAAGWLAMALTDLEFDEPRSLRAMRHLTGRHPDSPELVLLTRDLRSTLTIVVRTTAKE